MTTLEQVLTLLPQLSPAERTRVLEVLESDPRIAAQRAENQSALAHLDARVAADDDDDDSWWEDFTHALDQDRLSNRPLYPDQASTSV
jgi:hypothetical protein